MAKDVNIHIKAEGGDQASQQLHKVGEGAQKVGDKAEQMGAKGQTAAGKFSQAMDKLGAVGFMAIAAALAKASQDVINFYENLKRQNDEAVRNLETVRKKYEEIFEAMNAFDEKSRRAVTQDVSDLLQKTGVYAEVGMPVINEYIRQFKGKMPEAAYQQGLEGMLGYAARHGGTETVDLIQMMAGWGMETPEQQGEFRRMISSAAQASGLTDADVIGALARGSPTIKAMGWTPQQAVESIAVLAAGEAGRKKMSMPATTIQALGQPQVGDLSKYGIPEELGEDPQKLYMFLQAMSATMEQQDFYRLLTKIYGTEGAAGVSKLITAQRGGIQAAMTQAEGERGIQAEAVEEAQRRTTAEFAVAAAEAKRTEIALDVTTDEMYQEKVRAIGEEYRKILRRRHPVEWAIWEGNIPLLKSIPILSDVIKTPESHQLDKAAFEAWVTELSELEKIEIYEKYRGGWPDTEGGALRREWRGKTPQQQFEALTERPTTEIHYHNDTINQPRIGEPVTGPRSAPEDIY